MKIRSGIGYAERKCLGERDFPERSTGRRTSSKPGSVRKHCGIQSLYEHSFSRERPSSHGHRNLPQHPQRHSCRGSHLNGRAIPQQGYVRTDAIGGDWFSRRGSGKSHPTCIATLPSPLSLTEGNAVLFAPLDGHLPKLYLLEPIPSVPQVVFGK